MFSIAQIQDILKQSNLKVTQQRLVILRCLANSGIHPTIDWIYDTIKEDNPAISLATIYKTMETLVEAKVVKKVKCEDGKTRFDSNIEPHNHIYCAQTGRIFDFKDDNLQQIIETYLANKHLENFEVSDIQLQINGTIKNPNKPVHYKH